MNHVVPQSLSSLTYKTRKELACGTLHMVAGYPLIHIIQEKVKLKEAKGVALIYKSSFFNNKCIIYTYYTNTGACKTVQFNDKKSLHCPRNICHSPFYSVSSHCPKPVSQCSDFSTFAGFCSLSKFMQML